MMELLEIGNISAASSQLVSLLGLKFEPRAKTLTRHYRYFYVRSLIGDICLSLILFCSIFRAMLHMNLEVQTQHAHTWYNKDISHYSCYAAKEEFLTLKTTSMH